MSKQLLRSGTSIGANIREALEGQSKKDFIAKLSIAQKEAGESEYWLDLLCQTQYISEAEHKSLIQDLTDIIKMLAKILKTTKNNCQLTTDN